MTTNSSDIAILQLKKQTIQGQFHYYTNHLILFFSKILYILHTDELNKIMLNQEEIIHTTRSIDVSIDRIDRQINELKENCSKVVIQLNKIKYQQIVANVQKSLEKNQFNEIMQNVGNYHTAIDNSFATWNGKCFFFN